MNRPLPELSVPSLQTRSDAPVTHTRFYRVITPLFGGGVTPQQADPITTVRASEIRGQLRFWWRATQAGRYGKDGLRQMKCDEDKLWGSTSTPSQVQIEVRKGRGNLISQIKVNRFWGDPDSPISYGAFPLRKIGNTSLGGLYFDVTFELAVTLPLDPALRQQVLAAFWAWETFGGIGARTRRGFGAIYCEKVDGDQDVGPWHPLQADKDEVEKWLCEHLQRFVQPNDAPEGVPTLWSEYRIVVNYNLESKCTELKNAIEGACPKCREWLPALIAWYYPIEKMKQFRQSRSENYGRSYWPEPDEIRRRTKGFPGKHQELSKTRKFPRAVFGLPIVFHFKDEDIPRVTLQGSKHDRLASRLILRPLQCADGKFVSMALVLKGPELPPDGLKLVGANKGQETGIDTKPLTEEEAKFPPLEGKTDVLKAFLDTL
ncbi:type III-B CRISPR module RAMP protein Cmr1 [Chloroflexus sp.]|uniref:type III-B CRISPR module RAMP protein Cmr1 n=1 Tax=Chloroflexus sp. TaxID=1904827 RepID=UPI002ACDC712|nr:type III-B CRISPR module RAMP protein Cmr1 [Chloroflexus sp.]